MSPVRLLLEAEIRQLIGSRDALAAVREAFIKLARGEAVLPGVINLDLPEHRGEVHVKGAYLRGAPHFSIKEAAGFYENPARGLPVGSGLVLVFDATSGILAAVLFDNGYLTELRTGAAGALAADLLARRRIRRVGMVGCGTQARYQLEALMDVRSPELVTVYGRSPEQARAYSEEMKASLRLDVRPVVSVRDAVEGADLVVTVTPAREPLVRWEWIKPGTHITAVGSDGPDKQELDVEILARADMLVADRLEQCVRLGEIHHAVAAGRLTPSGVHAELGELAAGLKPGRRRDDEVTVADLTGVGVQDAAVADRVMAAALARGLGRTIEI